MTCLILVSKLYDVLPTFTWESAAGNVRKICLGVKILIPSPCIALCIASDAKVV